MVIVQLLVLLAVIFAGLVVALRWMMARHATSTIAHLQGLSQDYLRKQEELKKRLEESERQYQEQLLKGQEEVRQLKVQGLKDAEAARQQLVEQARQEAERIVQQAMQARDVLQQEVARTVETRAVSRACELLQEALPEGLRQAVHAQWVQELIANGLVPSQKIESREPIHEATLVSAFPLTPAQLKQLQSRLQEALGSPIVLQEQVDAKLVAGLVVTMGHIVLDGSLASSLQKAARHAQD